MLRCVGMATMPERRALLDVVLPPLAAQVDYVVLACNYPAHTALPDVPANVRVQRTVGMDEQKFAVTETLVEPSVILLCDDDVIYPRNYADVMVKYVGESDTIYCVHGDHYPEHPTAFLGQHRSYPRFCALRKAAPVNVAGTCSAAFRLAAPEVLRDAAAAGMADLWFARWAKQRERGIVAVVRPQRWLRPAAGRPHGSLFERSKIAGFQREADFLTANSPWRLYGNH